MKKMESFFGFLIGRHLTGVRMRRRFPRAVLGPLFTTVTSRRTSAPYGLLAASAASSCLLLQCHRPPSSTAAPLGRILLLCLAPLSRFLSPSFIRCSFSLLAWHSLRAWVLTCGRGSVFSSLNFLIA